MGRLSLTDPPCKATRRSGPCSWARPLRSVFRQRTTVSLSMWQATLQTSIEAAFGRGARRSRDCAVRPSET